jgi:uncharacterized membrane protein
MENNSSQTNNAPETATAVPVPPAPDTTLSAPDTFEFSETTIMAGLSYLGPMVFIPFLTKKGDAFIQFHVKQGLILFGIGLIVYILSSFMFHFIMPIISIVNLGLLVLSIIGIINALKRTYKELPLVGSYASHIKL